MRGYLKGLLDRMPAPAIDWARMAYDWVPPSLRYGKAYSESLSLFAKSDWWDEKEFEAYQHEKLRRLIDHSYNKVPYYRQVFDSASLKPSDIETISDLRKLPFLTKEIVRKNKPDLMAGDCASLGMEPLHTSGTTGAPLDFQIDRSTRAMERALVLRQLLWLGYQKKDIVAQITEDSFADPDRIYRYFPASKRLLFSFFNINDDKLRDIVQVLERFRPEFIKAYPSSLAVLSRWMERNNRKIPSPNYVITSSENLYPSIKKRAERVFQAPVVDHYGQNEQVAYAFQCKLANLYHVQMEYCVIELVPLRDGEWEIVGTNLHNLGMPLIRYRTGDIATLGAEPCECGRKQMTLSQLRGRVTDVIVTPERNIVAPVAMDYAFYHLEEIREAQIIQDDINTLQVKIVPWDKLSEGTRIALRDNILTYLNSRRMTVVIEEVDEIPRTKRGKQPFVICRLKPDDYT
jgi:phenylacetate-CoA ligase